MSTTLRWLVAAGMALAATLPAHASTVSGQIAIPTSDGGYRARIESSRVRVEGTSIAADVVPTDHYSGTFALANVPNGPVTLIFEEQEGYDSFTHASSRLALDVAGDVSGATFALEYHWKNLPSYPPPWRDARYDIWQPFFASDQVGFLSFYGRGFSPNVHELWRTTDGGASWQKIGEWVYGTASAVPQFNWNKDMLFFDADHGVMTASVGTPPGGPYTRYYPVGLVRTADGGATWTYVDLPNVPAGIDPNAEPAANGLVTLQAYAAIDAAHWIACGSENVGSYMGSGTPGYVTIWETDDAGASWRIAYHWREDYGACSALEANVAGRAILFDTPYAFGGSRRLVLRNPSGTWTEQAGNHLVTNSGYGPADVSMVGDTAWVRAQWFEATASLVTQGLYCSDDAGSTWRKISDALPQYMGFASLLKGFAPAGGPMYATYDGGVTWKYQSAGGGICCHGDRIWAFDTNRAIWQDGGVGDPNSLSDIFTYVEPGTPNFEVLPGPSIADAPYDASTAPRNVPVLALRLDSHGPVPLRLAGLKLQAAGTGDDSQDVQAVRLWWDRNGNRAVDTGDAEIASGTYAADDGTATLAPAGGPLLHEGNPLFLLVAYDFRAIRNLRTYTASLAAADVAAETADGGTPARLSATAPAGTIWPGATVTLRAYVDLSVAQVDSPDPALVGQNVTYAVTVRNGGPDDAAHLQLTDTLPAGVAFVSATASQGACARAGSAVTCDLGNLASGATTTATLVVRPTASGTLSNRAEVKATEIDGSTANNAATEATTVNPAADLAVAIVDGPDPVAQGQDVTITVTVTNNGPSDATGARATVSLPGLVGYSSSTSTAGACSAAGSDVSCAIGNLARGASATISVTARAGSAGSAEATVSVSATEADTVGANNVGRTSLTVTAAGGGGGGGGGCGYGRGSGESLAGALLALGACAFLRRRAAALPPRGGRAEP